MLNQDAYVISIDPISVQSVENKDLEVDSLIRKKYRALIGQISWASGTSRPDSSFDSCNLSCHQSKPTYRHIIEANKALKELKHNSFNMKYPKLSLDTAKIIVYCDASYGNLADGGSQGGHIIFMCDDKAACAPIIDIEVVIDGIFAQM